MAAADRLTLRVLRGDAIAPHLDALADLRIAVFRDWPYLYDGDAAYERRYLAAYAAPGAVVVGAFDGAAMVGAATAAPLERHDPDLARAVAAAGRDPASTYYLAESVLRPEWRGRGVGHRFFDLREAAAREGGFAVAAFCAVVRVGDHPARPAGARTHNAFWRGRGYAPVPGAVATMRWREVGRDAETDHRLQVWARDL